MHELTVGAPVFYLTSELSYRFMVSVHLPVMVRSTGAWWTFKVWRVSFKKGEEKLDGTENFKWYAVMWIIFFLLVVPLNASWQSASVNKNFFPWRIRCVSGENEQKFIQTWTLSCGTVGNKHVWATSVVRRLYYHRVCWKWWRHTCQVRQWAGEVSCCSSCPGAVGSLSDCCCS